MIEVPLPFYRAGSVGHEIYCLLGQGLARVLQEELISPRGGGGSGSRKPIEL